MSHSQKDVLCFKVLFEVGVSRRCRFQLSLLCVKDKDKNEKREKNDIIST